MTLNDKIKVVMDFFGDFWLRHTFQERIAQKSLEIHGTACICNFQH